MAYLVEAEDRAPSARPLAAAQKKSSSRLPAKVGLRVADLGDLGDRPGAQLARRAPSWRDRKISKRGMIFGKTLLLMNG